MLITTQITAAPKTSESVTGAACVICGITFAPRFTYDVRSRVMKSFFIISAYWTGSGWSSPKSCRTCLQRLLVGVASGDARRGVDARRREEDEERQHADREEHEHHRDEPADDEAQHQSPPRELGARIERVAHAVAEHVQREHGDARSRCPGAIATTGRV